KIDNTLELLTGDQLKTNLSLNNVDNTSDQQKVDSGPISDALDLKSDLESPAFTGNPTAPTPDADDDSESIATTEYVQGELTDRIQSVSTIADLKALTDSSDGQLYNVVGAGTWRYDAASTAVADEQNGIVQPASMPGRFIYDGDLYNLSNSTAYGEGKKVKPWGVGSISDGS